MGHYVKKNQKYSKIRQFKTKLKAIVWPFLL